MFNFQGSELVIILLLALVVLGPEKLPDAMRQMGKAYSELRRMSSSFQQEFRSVVDEPMREMRETADLIRDSADFNSLADGERQEKPKTATMPTVDLPETTGEPAAEPAADATADTPADLAADLAADPGDTDPGDTDAGDEPVGRVQFERIESERPASSPAPPPPFTPSGGLVGDDAASTDAEPPG